MKTNVLVAVAFIATPAMADSVNGVIEDHYRDDVITIPHVERVCNSVDVPVYETRNNTGDRIAGAIIGGILGNQVGSGRGNTAATVIGSVVGSEIAGNAGEKSIVGYRREEQCHNNTTYERKYERKYSHSTVEFTYEGHEYRVRFTK